VVIATVFALHFPKDKVGPSILLPAVISVVPALLMVSTVRFRSFRNLISPQTQQARVITGVLVLAFVVGLVVAPAVTMLVVAYSYVLTAPVGVLTAPVRRRMFGEAAVAPPRVKQQSVFLPLHDDSEDLDETEEDESQPL